MPETVEKITEPSETHNAATEQAAPKAPKPLLEPTQSKGEKVFNWSVYSGLNYWVNLGISIVVADIFTAGKGRKPLDWMIGKTAKGIASTKVMSLEKAHHNSRVGLETLTLLTGGWALLVPMKWLEDRKRPIVHWLNEKMGVDQTAPDGHKQTAEEIYIKEEQPKQSWGNVIKRRLIASAAVMGTGMVLDHALADKKQLRSSEYPIDPYDPNSEIIKREGHLGGKERTTDFVANLVNKGYGKIVGKDPKDIDRNHIAQRYLNLAVLDTIFTKLTAIIMHKTNGAGVGQAPKEMGDDPAPDLKDPIGTNKLEYKPGQVTGAPQAKNDCKPIGGYADKTGHQKRDLKAMASAPRSSSFGEAALKSQMESSGMALAND